jgi:hypothetical protein
MRLLLAGLGFPTTTPIYMASKVTNSSCPAAKKFRVLSPFNCTPIALA